ncbi:acyl-CoA carboxylase subunit epsilon [Streptomyces sp. NPDC101152]|uniref:acyl-CoA carboxylase subunit epsilon n=1 Tax=Streptomyces sp. NPDC101152 TaxID=3366116 RepID=UPI0037F76F9E
MTATPDIMPTPTPSDLLTAASLRVLRGEPSAEELAAVMAVLTLRLTPRDEPAAQHRTTAAWTRPERLRAYNCPRAWHG